MTESWQISRRTVLRGLGTAIALPWLEAMSPGLALAGQAAKKPPVRMAFMYVPNGMHMPDWTPSQAGDSFELPYVLEPLRDAQGEFSIYSGLAQDGARPHKDGAGDHARSLASFLTGAHPRKTHGADIKNGVSVDQVAAQRIGDRTRFPSLELGCDGGQQSGNCDSGYSCAYSSNISWRTETAPVAKEIDPRLVFERLFQNGGAVEVKQNQAKRERYRKSILDFALEDANQLRGKLGARDQRKMDEYLSSVRELEMRIVRAEQWNKEGLEQKLPDYAKPTGIPQDYAEHIRLMCDMLALAFQGDLTRVSTFVVANESSNRSYGFIDVPEGHHDLSHHGGDTAKHAKIRDINRFHATQLAYLLGKLKEIKEGAGSLLDNCMLVYGSGIGDGDRHNHDDLPILLAGKGGGTIRQGRHVKLEKETPLNNLYLSMLDRLDASTDKLGNSTGRLDL